MLNREMRWPTPRKRGQLHSSLHVSRRQPKTKISSLRRTRANRTRKRSNRSTKAEVRRKSEKISNMRTSLEIRPNTIARAQARDRAKAHRKSVPQGEERELEKPETNQG